MNRTDRPWYDIETPQSWSDVVLAVLLGVLISWVLYPMLEDRNQARNRELARRIACRATLRQIGLALEMYASDHGGRCPMNPDDPTPAGGFRLLAGYVREPNTFRCSSDPRITPARSVAGLTATNVSYGYIAGLMWNGPTPQPIVFDRIDAFTNGATWATNGNHKAEGGNVLFTDGRVRWLEKWDNALKGENGDENRHENDH